MRVKLILCPALNQPFLCACQAKHKPVQVTESPIKIANRQYNRSLTVAAPFRVGAATVRERW